MSRANNPANTNGCTHLQVWIKVADLKCLGRTNDNACDLLGTTRDCSRGLINGGILLSIHNVHLVNGPSRGRQRWRQLGGEHQGPLDKRSRHHGRRSWSDGHIDGCGGFWSNLCNGGTGFGEKADRGLPNQSIMKATLPLTCCFVLRGNLSHK